MYIESSKFPDMIFSDDNNRIWLERRHRIPIHKRREEYEAVGLGDLFRKCSSEEIEQRLDSLDLSYLDPLTGIQGQEYFLRNRVYFENNGMVIALKGETIEYVNRKLGYSYGNLIMYAMSRLLRSRCGEFMRLAFRGRKFIVLDKDRTLFNSVNFLLSRTCLRTSDGYEMKGIDIDFLSVSGESVVDKGYFLNSGVEKDDPGFRDLPIGTKIYRIAKLSNSVEWCDIYEYGKFSERIGGELLQHLLGIGG